MKKHDDSPIKLKFDEEPTKPDIFNPFQKRTDSNLSQPYADKPFDQN